jgi:hypothetical protein
MVNCTLPTGLPPRPAHWAADCEACGKCRKCPSLGCTCKHGGNGRAKRAENNARTLKLHRAAAATLPERDATRSAKAAGALSLKESDLARPVSDAISSSRTRSTFDKSLRLVNDILGTNICERFLTRSESGYCLEEVKDTRLGKDAVSAIETILKSICMGMSKDASASSYLLEQIGARLLPSIRPSLGSLSVESSADCFIKARCKLEARLAFAKIAMLFDFERSIELNQLLELSAQRIKCDDAFISNLSSKRYHYKKSENQQENFIVVAGEKEESDVGPATASEKALSPENQIDLRARWGRSRLRMSQAKIDWNALSCGRALEPKHNICRISTAALFELMQFIEGISLGWKGGSMRTVNIDRGAEIMNMPVLNMHVGVGEAWELFKEKARSGNLARVGYPLFRTVFGALALEINESHSLSYFFTDALLATRVLGGLVARLQFLWNEYHRDDSTIRPLDEELESMQKNGVTFEALQKPLQTASNL